MKWDQIGDQPCSIARSLSVIGDSWTAMIIRNAFLGVRKFEDFQKSLGVTRHVLSDRLKLLVEHEVLMKVPYSDTKKRFEYRLTPKGKDLYPVLLSLMKWGDRWMDLGLGAPVEYTHKVCGHKFTPVLVCSECNKLLLSKDVIATLGSGYFSYFLMLQKS